jgi:hypothetical protein
MVVFSMATVLEIIKTLYTNLSHHLLNAKAHCIDALFLCIYTYNAPCHSILLDKGFVQDNRLFRDDNRVNTALTVDYLIPCTHHAKQPIEHKKKHEEVNEQVKY